MKIHEILTLDNLCTGCFACQNICPKQAILLPENKEGFYYPKINESKCVDCGLCDKICPQLLNKPSYILQHAYYGYSRSDEQRKKSSSGGVFGELARLVLNEGGVVFGATFTYGDVIRLDCKSTEETSLESIQKSKYVQCYVGDAFSKIKRYLDAGKKVLYCGTPCEVDGLRSFLRKDYDSLICVDFICHGVPSSSMLREYLTYKGFRNVNNIDFRPKNRSWVDDLVIDHGKNKRYIRPWEFDEFYSCFQSNIMLRKSCYNCRYCNGRRYSDITLADFWKYHKYDPTIYDKRGLSLVLSNSNKGNEIIDIIQNKNYCFLREIDLDYAKYVYERDRHDPRFHYNIDKRNAFINDVYEKGYSFAFKRSGLRRPLIERFKSYVKQFIRRFKSE